MGLVTVLGPQRRGHDHVGPGAQRQRRRAARHARPSAKEIDRNAVLLEESKKRILIIDGAMGTEVQKHRLTEKDYRGARFADWHRDLKGNNDLLILTQPGIIAGVHRAYLEAGADVIETSTFNSTSVAMADYGM